MEGMEMRIAIFMMLLAVVSNNAKADWVKVAHNKKDGLTAYANTSTFFQKKGDMVKMWVLYDQRKAEKLTLPAKNVFLNCGLIPS